MSALLLLSGYTYAQQKTEVVEKIDYLEKVEKYRKMRGTGATLTVIGSILAVVGTSTMVNNMDLFTDEDNSSKYVTGMFCALAGYGMLGAGVPLWIVGGVQHKKYSAKAQELSVKINATPQSQGLTLSFRF